MYGVLKKLCCTPLIKVAVPSESGVLTLLPRENQQTACLFSPEKYCEIIFAQSASKMEFNRRLNGVNIGGTTMGRAGGRECKHQQDYKACDPGAHAQSSLCPHARGIVDQQLKQVVLYFQPSYPALVTPRWSKKTPSAQASAARRTSGQLRDRPPPLRLYSWTSGHWTPLSWGSPLKCRSGGRTSGSCPQEQRQGKFQR